MPPAVPVVESVTQLTDDGIPKDGQLVSDGSRIYFNEGQSKSWRIAQVSVSGGPTAPVDTSLVSPQLTAVAPDGSALLAVLGGMDAATGPLWSIPLPAGEPRRLGNIEAQWASYFPDGRIIFSTTSELYVADKDGSNPRKLFAMPAASTPSPIVSPDGERITFNVSPSGGANQSRSPKSQRKEQIFVLCCKTPVVQHGFQTASISSIAYLLLAGRTFGRFQCKPGFFIGRENQFDLPTDP